jgi:uncharacterized protein YecT (DUF1311 family)
MTALVLLTGLAFTPPISAAEPSFDCRTARTARELATCADSGLSAVDRELAAAWRHAMAHLDKATGAVLRQDQKKFVASLDSGFDSELWGKAEPPDREEMRRQISKLRRGDDPDHFASLQEQLRERITFLRKLAPAKSFAGLWKNQEAELLIVPADHGAYRVTFGMTSFGWEKYHCHFTAAFEASGADLVASVAHNTDPELDEDIASSLRISRVGEAVTIVENIPDNAAGSAVHRICPREPALTAPLFHTSLAPSEAYRLKPETF